MASLALPVVLVFSGASAAGLLIGAPVRAGAAGAATDSPTLTGINPSSGIVGTSVTLTGTQLSTETAVHFGNAESSSVKVKSAEELIAVAPPGKGTVTVSVTTSVGTSNTEPFTYEPPVLTSLTPKSGHPGTVVTVKGSGFSKTAVVRFAGKALSGATVTSTKAITFPVPLLAKVKKKTAEPVLVHTPTGTSATATFTYVPFAPLEVTTSSLPVFVATASPAYGPVTLSASGGTGHDTWSPGAGFPKGLTLTPASGTISGRPETPATKGVPTATDSFGVTVKDAEGKTASATLTLSVADGFFYIFPGSAPVASVDSPYSASFADDYYFEFPLTQHLTSWSAAGLPAGLSITGYWGTIDGTPTEVGTFPVTVSVTWGGAFFATVAFTLVVQGFHITTTRIAGFTSTYFAESTTGPTSLSVTTATGPVQWSAQNLPGGLSISATTGTISGAPGKAGATVGTHTFTATATDAKGATTQSVTVRITQGPFVITDSGVGPAYLDTLYEADLYAAGQPVPGDTPARGIVFTTWTASGLPAGLSISSLYGDISGTPTEAGTFSVTVSDENDGVFFDVVALSLTVSPFHVTTTQLAEWSTEFTFPTTSGATQFEATGGTGSYTWSVGAGFPAGMTLTATGKIEPTEVTGLPGAPYASGTYHFTVTAKDGLGATAEKSFTLDVAQGTFHITAVADQKVDAGSSYALFLGENSPSRGQEGATQWFATGLPPGLVIGESGTYDYGVVYGTPTTPGTYAVTARVWSAGGGEIWATTQFTISVYQSLDITTTSLPAGTVTEAYKAVTLTATGGTGSYSWSAKSLPTGLTLSPTGVISGTPHKVKQYTVSLTVDDGTGASTSKTLPLTINYAPLEVTTSTMPPAIATRTYSYQLQSSGGTGTNVWEYYMPHGVTPGTVPHFPSGFTFYADGVVSGKTSQSGDFTVEVELSDHLGTHVIAMVHLSVYGVLRITTEALHAAHAGYAYSATLTSSGGTGEEQWSMTGTGKLPTGLTFHSTGKITGTVAASDAGKTYAFTVVLDDDFGTSTSAALSIYVTSHPPLEITTTSLPGGVVGKAYSAQLHASGGTGTDTWTWASTPVFTTFDLTDVGLKLASGGKITGTPVETTFQAGDYPLTYRYLMTVTDKLGTSVTELIPITISLPT